jgi:DNA modification methylase
MKFGGYLLLFGLDRQLGPLHYYAVKNGFEINQSLYWYFVSNFPKSTDASKMLDKRGTTLNAKEIGDKLKEAREKRGMSKKAADELFCDGTSNYMWYEGRSDGVRIPSDEAFEKIGEEWEELEPFVKECRSKLKKIGTKKQSNLKVAPGQGEDRYITNIDITEANTNLSKIFDGYKYSKAPLKQMVETICIFSKPTKNKSVLDDIIEWSEGVDLLNYAPKVGKKERNMGLDNVVPTTDGAKGNGINRICSVCSTPQLKKELCKCENPEWIYPPMKNTHPTLKPIKLISEIAKLFKLPDVVDQKVYIPFSGSFSEVIGFVDAGYNPDNITACEMNPEYVEIGKKRLEHFYDEIA